MSLDQCTSKQLALMLHQPSRGQQQSSRWKLLASSICTGKPDERSVKETFAYFYDLIDFRDLLSLDEGRQLIAKQFGTDSNLWNMFELEEDQWEQIRLLSPEQLKELDRSILICMQEQVKIGQWDYIVTSTIDSLLDELIGDTANPIYLLWVELEDALKAKALSTKTFDRLLSAWSKLVPAAHHDDSQKSELEIAD